MTNQEIVERLLWPTWCGIPENFKVRYARNIWEQFENNIRSAAYTSSPTRFFESLCRRLGIEIRGDDLRAVTETLETVEGSDLLRALRDETTILVLLCRLKNQERREQWKKEHNENVSVRDAGNSAQFDLA